jgi:hypothetical protein
LESAYSALNCPCPAVDQDLASGASEVVEEVREERLVLTFLDVFVCFVDGESADECEVVRFVDADHRRGIVRDGARLEVLCRRGFGGDGNATRVDGAVARADAGRVREEHVADGVVVDFGRVRGVTGCPEADAVASCGGFGVPEVVVLREAGAVDASVPVLDEVAVVERVPRAVAGLVVSDVREQAPEGVFLGFVLVDGDLDAGAVG